MFAVQPDACAPIARAFERGDPDIRPVAAGETVAEAIAIGDPMIGGKRVLDAARRSGGGVLGVPEELILEAQALLARDEGLFVEPTGAVGVAGIMELAQDGTLGKDSVVVATITGEGLNAPEDVDKWAASPQKVEPDIDKIAALLG